MRTWSLAVILATVATGCTNTPPASSLSHGKPMKQTLTARVAGELCAGLDRFHSLEKKASVPEKSQRVQANGSTLAMDNGIVTCQKTTARAWTATVHLKNQTDLTKKPNFFVYRSDAAKALCGELERMGNFENKLKVPPASRIVMATPDSIRLGSNALTCRTTNEELRAYITL